MPEMTRQLWFATPMMRGDDVMTLQQRLRALGIALDTDGLFGRATRDAVISFQHSVNLTPDGVVGAATWGRLFDTTSAAVGTATVSLPTMSASAILTDAV